MAVAAGASGVGVYFVTKSDSGKGGAGQVTPTPTPIPIPRGTQKGLAGVVLARMWKNCAVENIPPPGAVQSAVCLPPSGSTVPFPDQVTLSLYPDTKALLAAYTTRKQSDQNSAGLVEGKGRCDGAGWNGDGEWLHGTGAKGGHRFCYFDANQNAVIVWTHERAPGAEAREPPRSPRGSRVGAGRTARRSPAGGASGIS